MNSGGPIGQPQASSRGSVPKAWAMRNKRCVPFGSRHQRDYAVTATMHPDISAEDIPENSREEARLDPGVDVMLTRHKQENRMSSLLDRIKAYKVQEIADRQAARSPSEVEAAARRAPRTRPFHRRLVETRGWATGLLQRSRRRPRHRACSEPTTILLP